MLWLITKKSSNQITACNLHKKDGVHSVWVTRASGKNMKVLESNNYEEVKEIRSAIDYAIKQRSAVLELDI